MKLKNTTIPNYWKTILLLIFILGFSVAGNAQDNLLSNSGYEENALNNWAKASLAGADGTVDITTNAYTGGQACWIATTSTDGVDKINKFGVKSDNYTTTGHIFTAKVMAKTDAAGVAAGVGFKFQIAGVTTADENKYYASQEMKLTETYTEYIFIKDVSTTDLKTVRLVFHCGGYVGNYYFDEAVLEDGTSSSETGTIIPVKVVPINSITTTEKVVAFTFDDGADAELSPQIAALFEAHGGHATFFNIGNNLSGNEDVVRNILLADHEIGNHSMSHSRLPDFTLDNEIYNDIVDFQELYKTTFNYIPKLFRAPFLDYGQIREDDEITPAEDNRVGGVLTEQNLLPVNASVYAGDASTTVSSNKIVDKITAEIVSGAVILCHERDHTLAALKNLLPTLKAEGYKFVTVSELLRIAEGWTLIQPNDERIHKYGSNYIKKQNNELVIHRHSDAVYAGTTLINLFNPEKARTSSGIILKFKTTSPKINLRFKIIAGNIANPWFGIFQNDEFIEYQSFSYSPDSEILIEATSQHTGEEVLYEITLPLWTDVNFMGIEVENGYDIVEFAKEEKAVYVAFGNSITHGRGQNGTYETYPYLLSEMLDFELFNLAVGGGKTSQVMAEMIRDDFPKIDVMTILIGYNDYNGEGVDATTYHNRYEDFLTTVRSKHTDTKLFCITMTYTTNTVSQTTGIDANDFRDVVKNIVEERQTAGDENIFLIDGEAITTAESLNDVVHLSVQGASDFADSLFHAMNLTLNPTTGFSEPKSDANFINTYPNPAKDSINLSGLITESNIMITNYAGKQMISLKATGKKQKIDISMLASGIYLITYQTDRGKSTVKFVKE